MKYKIIGALTVSCWTEVEADTEEEALEIAKERELANMPAHVLYPDSDESWHFENDGLPQKIRIDNE